jgi:hypothetical protein
MPYKQGGVYLHASPIFDQILGQAPHVPQFISTAWEHFPYAAKQGIFVFEQGNKSVQAGNRTEKVKLVRRLCCYIAKLERLTNSWHVRLSPRRRLRATSARAMR